MNPYKFEPGELVYSLLNSSSDHKLHYPADTTIIVHIKDLSHSGWNQNVQHSALNGLISAGRVGSFQWVRETGGTMYLGVGARADAALYCVYVYSCKTVDVKLSPNRAAVLNGQNCYIRRKGRTSQLPVCHNGLSDLFRLKIFWSPVNSLIIHSSYFKKVPIEGYWPSIFFAAAWGVTEKHVYGFLRCVPSVPPVLAAKHAKRKVWRHPLRDRRCGPMLYTIVIGASCSFRIMVLVLSTRTAAARHNQLGRNRLMQLGCSRCDALTSHGANYRWMFPL